MELFNLHWPTSELFLPMFILFVGSPFEAVKGLDVFPTCHVEQFANRRMKKPDYSIR